MYVLYYIVQVLFGVTNVSELYYVQMCAHVSALCNVVESCECALITHK